MSKTGIILANLGTPDGTDYWSMRRYLSEFLSDRRVVDMPAWKWQPILQGIILTIRPSRSGANYRKIWDDERGGSPLLLITRDQTDALRTRLANRFGDQIEVAFAMRYGNPSINDVLAELVSNGCDRVLFFPLYPQYAGASTATANDQFFRALMDLRAQPASRTVPPYFDHPLYIGALANSVTQTLGDTRPDAIVASYHGMPQSHIDAGDPYYDQCLATSQLLRAELGLGDDQLITTFQSRFGRDEWIKPYTIQEVVRLARAGKKNIAVLAPGFSADCLETLEEINGEIREAFLDAGGNAFTYIPALNTNPDHLDMIEAITLDNLKGWVDQTSQP